MRLTRAFDVERFPLKKKIKEKGRRGREERKNTASSRVVRQNNFRNEGNSDERQRDEGKGEKAAAQISLDDGFRFLRQWR